MVRFRQLSRERLLTRWGDPGIHRTSEFDRLVMGRRDLSVLQTIKIPTILVGYNVNEWRPSDDCYTTDGETLTFPRGPSGCWDAGFLPKFWERRGISRSLLWCPCFAKPPHWGLI
ncbi:hypothetical protein PGTUg99_033534 [Puccinia graminis f. sp. tritici]|uniref:Uncharacterized protein n=1 Tax=Puccinia graminis f. sp. tritici TaxID=56615 RepID=A0A5B0RW31_PUCGR|nr:hypothetical protein PGTUg99_033534 [Puccinia graminis f. sp. tritici]